MSDSHRTIFKSSTLIGGVQAITIILGIVRTKAMALFLGPTGVGVMGLYTTATDLIGTITRMGIDSSGIRQIAEAVGTKDEDKIARTAVTLRRISTISGILGMLIVLMFCVPLNRLTFGSSQPIWGMALMSLALLFKGISSGQLALLKGLRHLKKIAMSQILAALFSTIVCIVIIYFLREDGIVLFLVCVAAFGLLASWWYARKVHIKQVRLSVQNTLNESKKLLGMGIAFMFSALFIASTAYIIRILILHKLGENAVGLYQATYTLSTLYVGFILNAMLVDFYPRLTALANDNTAVNRLVNEQTEVGLIIAVPGVLATITLAPLVLSMFYSEEFLAATNIIRWQSMGVALRVISWPMGFIQLAKGKATLFILTEFAGSVIYIVFILIGINLFELEGIGIAFVLLYLCSIIMMLFVSRSLSGFKWSNHSKQLLLISVFVLVLNFLVIRFLPSLLGMICGLVITISVTFVALYHLKKLLGVNVWAWLKNKRNAH